MNELWVEKYRPKTLNDYVFQDDRQRNQITTWVKEKSIPHLLLSGHAGIGKTTLAKVLLNELNINPLDILEINASRTNSVDDVRDTIVKFSQMIPFGDFKVILLDEADYLSVNAQAALRGVMEEFHNFVRFILTCNYKHKIIHALHSRCQAFEMNDVDKTEYTARMATILVNENIEFTLETLDTFVKIAYPDLRKCINNAQQNCINGVLVEPDLNRSDSNDFKLQMVQLFKQGKIGDARKLLCGNIRPEDVDEIFTWLYSNVELFGDDLAQEKAILIIKQGMVDHTLISDPEINLSATLIRLSHIND